VTSGVPEKVHGGWHIPLAGADVTLISIDQALALDLWVSIERSILVRIERGFTFSTGITSEEVQWSSPTELGRFAELYGASAVSIDLSTAGELYLRFEDGRSIRVRPDPQYEAFQVSSSENVVSGGFEFISTPGGGLTSFG
jgi:hypothetical protein